MKRLLGALLAAWSLSAPAATVNLVWDASAGATGYTLGYGTAPGSRATLQEVGPPTTGIVNGLAAGTTYYFAVRAHDATNQSAFSGEVAVTTLPGPPPMNQPPTVSLAANPTNCVVPCSANLTATAADADGTIASVALYKDSGVNPVQTLTVAPYVFTVALPVAASSSYTATATDNANATRASNIVTLTGTDPPPPSGSPVFVLEAETAWNTSGAKTTAAINVQAGDVLVAFAVNEGYSGAALGVSGGGSQTWVNRQRVAASGYSEVDVWTTVASAAKSMSVTFTGSGGMFGGNVLVFRGASVGASAKANGSGAPSVNLATTQASSAIVVVNGDWTALDGAARVYRTNAGAVTQQSYFRDAQRYTVYGGFHPNAGPAGTYSLGLNAPGGQKFSVVAIEIKGQ